MKKNGRSVCSLQSKLSSGRLTAGLLALFALLGAVTLASCGDNGDPTSPPGGNPHPLETWTEVSSKPLYTSSNSYVAIYAIAYGGTAEPKKLVAVGQAGKIAYSSNGGSTWNVVSTPADLFSSSSSYTINDVTWGGPDGQRKFVAVGNQGTNYYSSIGYSSDGITWTKATLDPSLNIKYNTVIWDGSRFIAGSASGIIASSLNGIDWTQLGTSSKSNNNAIAYGGGKYVAVAEGNSSYWKPIVYSDDGITWTDTILGGISFSTSTIRALAYGGPVGQEKFVEGGNDGKMAYSSDGITWTAIDGRPLETRQITQITYGGDYFVACGEQSNLAYSVDGITWTTVSKENEPFHSDGLPDGVTLTSIVYADGKFIIGTTSGGVAYSGILE